MSIALGTYFECGTYLYHTEPQKNCSRPVLCGTYMYHTRFLIDYVTKSIMFLSSK